MINYTDYLNYTMNRIELLKADIAEHGNKMLSGDKLLLKSIIRRLVALKDTKQSDLDRYRT